MKFYLPLQPYTVHPSVFSLHITMFYALDNLHWKRSKALDLEPWTLICFGIRKAYEIKLFVHRWWCFVLFMCICVHGGCLLVLFVCKQLNDMTVQIDHPVWEANLVLYGYRLPAYMMFWCSSLFLVFKTNLSLRILLPSDDQLDIEDKDGCSHKFYGPMDIHSHQLGFSSLGSGTGLHKQVCNTASQDKMALVEVSTYNRRSLAQGLSSQISFTAKAGRKTGFRGLDLRLG